jgi:hypothetical protein
MEDYDYNVRCEQVYIPLYLVLGFGKYIFGVNLDKTRTKVYTDKYCTGLILQELISTTKKMYILKRHDIHGCSFPFNELLITFCKLFKTIFNHIQRTRFELSKSVDVIWPH